MRATALVCLVGLLGACAHTDIEQQHEPAARVGPTVSFPYRNAAEYHDDALKADNYCAQRYNADAQPTADYSENGGKATFICVTK